jgi:hypothetical protein
MRPVHDSHAWYDTPMRLALLAGLLSTLVVASCATLPPAPTGDVPAPWPQPDPRITPTTDGGAAPPTPTPKSPVPVPPLKPDLVPPPPRIR